MNRAPSTVAVPLPAKLFRGAHRLRIALVGMPACGKSTLFSAVSSTWIQTGELAGTRSAYRECAVQIGLDEARVIDLPSIGLLRDQPRGEWAALRYLLWGDTPAPVSAHEPEGKPAPFEPPHAIIQVLDATALERHLGLTLELAQLGRPMVIALNMMDEARRKGLHINIKALSRRLGVQVVPTVATMGHGIAELFAAAAAAVRRSRRPLAQPPSPHLAERLRGLSNALGESRFEAAFRMPHALLLRLFAEDDLHIADEMRQHFPAELPVLERLRDEAGAGLPRTLGEELRADRHHRVATLVQAVTRAGAGYERRDWRYWADELFLHPRWGLVGSLVVFAAVLFVVFEVSAEIDALTSARMVTWVSGWTPQTLGGTIGRAVADGLVGLLGIVVPYMIPLVMLLVALEESGVMPRIAFVVDRGFHRIGLHGAIAVPFLMGLGCNVPAISAAARESRGRERVIAAVLITFVPCSARSAVILAIAGKYLGGGGVFAIFAISALVIAVAGNLLARKLTAAGPGQVQEIPPYARPRLRKLLTETWARTNDILTIVTPLLVGGSIVLALLAYVHADVVINSALAPITTWWLGLPAVLGVPILFGVLRKELSLLMVYQALGTFEVATRLNDTQMMTFLIFLTLYVPCISTFAVMMKSIGRREAFFSVSLSVGVALGVAGIVRAALGVGGWLA